MFFNTVQLYEKLTTKLKVNEIAIEPNTNNIIIKNKNGEILSFLTNSNNLANKAIDKNGIIDNGILVYNASQDKFLFVSLSSISGGNQNLTISDIENLQTVLDEKATKITATITEDGLLSKVDKEKLNSIEFSANNYIHPSFHSASMIQQDSDNRFVSDSEKTNWNNKQDNLGFIPENISNKGIAGGYCPLDASVKIPPQYLPSYVDDVIEKNGVNNFPVVGESGKIYVDTIEDKTYRWTGSLYKEISASLAQADTAIKLATGRIISLSGDASGSIVFDGSSDIAIPLLLSNSGVTAGTHLKVTVDSKGRVISGSVLSASDIPNLDASKITSGTLTVNTTGSASKLSTPRVITLSGDTSGNASFDGSSDINISVTVTDNSHNHGNSTITDVDWGKITNKPTNSLGSRTVSTSAPSGGVDGDIWYQI